MKVRALGAEAHRFAHSIPSHAHFLLLVVGYLMDTFSAIAVTVPLNHIDPEPCVQECGTSGSVQGERGNPPH